MPVEKMKKYTHSLVLVIVMLMSACSPAAKPTTSSSIFCVLAAETFLGDIAQNIAGDRIKIETLLPPTVDPHTFEPTPQDAVKITESQMLIVNGLGYETWLAKTLANVSGQRVVVVATKGLMPNPDPSGQHPDGDPHMWMNPLNAIQYVDNIRDGLIQIDPAEKDFYTANADAYIAKLKDLDQWVKEQVAQIPQQKRLLVTNHDALGYFAQAYHFKIVGAVIPSVTTEASPSAQQMASLIDTIKSSGAPAIFLDIGENQNLAKQIASESGAKVITDLYVESISVPSGPAPTYIDMIKHDVTLIANALK
jgi:zinc/manganese transport system substrate-binding protein